MRGKGYYILKPESSNKQHYEPIVVKQDFQVQGVVCAILKRGSELLELQYQDGEQSI
jgi:hypothetical protein